MENLFLERFFFYMLTLSLRVETLSKKHSVKNTTYRYPKVQIIKWNICLKNVP